MYTRQQIVDAARECLGTPYHHQGRLCGVGLDCVGVLCHVATRIGLPFEDVTNYGRSPDPSMMGRELRKYLQQIPVPEAKVGDIYWMAWQLDPQHVAILTPLGIVHTAATLRRCVEHSLGAWSSTVRVAFRIPGVGVEE